MNALDVLREALTDLRDCGDRPGMYAQGEAALVALRRVETAIEAAREYMDCFDLRGVEVAISDEAFAALRAALRDLEEKA